MIYGRPNSSEPTAYLEILQCLNEPGHALSRSRTAAATQVRTIFEPALLPGQQMNNGARRTRRRGIAGANQPRKRSFHSAEIGQLRFNQLELVSGHGACFCAGRSFLEREQTCDLPQRKSKRLSAFDKADAPDRLRRVASESTVWLCGLLQQTSPLVVADRFNVYPALARNSADRQIFTHGPP